MCKSTYCGTWRALDSAEQGQLAEALQERGLQVTLQREAVWEVVFGCPGHICAEHILAVVSRERPGLRMNKTTVYRTLDVLVELGLVSEHRCEDGPTQYEPASRGHHSHLLCQRCGTLSDLDHDVAADLAESLRARYGFLVDLESHPILGLCGHCRGQHEE